MKSAKLLLFTVALLLICGYSKAQGNLQFNRAVYLELVCNGSSFIDSTITVPTGKVWKVESGNVPGYTAYLALGASSGSLAANAQIVAYQNTYDIHNFPIWLPTGTYHVQFFEGSTGQRAFISAIEFNIVP